MSLVGHGYHDGGTHDPTQGRISSTNNRSSKPDLQQQDLQVCLHRLPISCWPCMWWIFFFPLIDLLDCEAGSGGWRVRGGPWWTFNPVITQQRRYWVVGTVALRRLMWSPGVRAHTLPRDTNKFKGLGLRKTTGFISSGENGFLGRRPSWPKKKKKTQILQLGKNINKNFSVTQKQNVVSGISRPSSVALLHQKGEPMALPLIDFSFS